jgi:multidrug efflux pump subunit AcrA (membrane-fusion protein)
LRFKLNFIIVDRLLQIFLLLIFLTTILVLTLFWNVEMDIGLDTQGVFTCGQCQDIYAFTDVIVDKVMVPNHRIVKRNEPVLTITDYQLRNIYDETRQMLKSISRRRDALSSVLEAARANRPPVISKIWGEAPQNQMIQKIHFPSQLHLVNAFSELLAQLDATTCVEAQEAKRLAMIEKSLSQTTIDAPFDSYILTTDIKSLQSKLVHKGELLVQLGDKQHLNLYCSVKEKDSYKIKPGQNVRIYPTAFPAETAGPIAGKVIDILAPEFSANHNHKLYPALDTKNNVFTVVVAVAVDSNPSTPAAILLKKLRPGHTARAKIITCKERVLKIVFDKIFR